MKNWGMAFIALSIILTFVLAWRLVQRHQPGETPISAGLIVVKDQETGQFRSPTAAEFSELDVQALPTRAEESILERRQDGSLRLIPGIEHISYSKVSVMDDGSRAFHCETESKEPRAKGTGDRHDH